MKTILYLISPERESQKAFDWAVQKAQSLKARLVLGYIIDEDVLQEIQVRLANSAIIGDKTGKQICEALTKEHSERGQLKIQELMALGEAQNVQTESAIEKGSYLDCVEDLVGQYQSDVLVVVEKKMKFFKRLLEGRESDKVRSLVSCELKVFPFEEQKTQE